MKPTDLDLGALGAALAAGARRVCGRGRPGGGRDRSPHAAADRRRPDGNPA